MHDIKDETIRSAISAARQNLSAFVREMAHKTAHEIGFGWDAVADAPSDYGSLREAFDISKASKEALPVSSLYCDNVIYDDDATNHAMRFWHDADHVKLGLNFGLVDELELGLGKPSAPVSDAGVSSTSCSGSTRSGKTTCSRYAAGSQRTSCDSSSAASAWASTKASWTNQRARRNAERRILAVPVREKQLKETSDEVWATLTPVIIPALGVMLVLLLIKYFWSRLR
jgi:hypothetical protein